MQVQEGIIAYHKTCNGNEDGINSFIAEWMHIKFSLQKNDAYNIINSE